MKTIQTALISLIALSALAIAAEPRKMPDFTKAFPSEEFLGILNFARADFYSYGSDLKFASLKKQFIRHMGEGWVEAKPDPADMKKGEEEMKLGGAKLLGNMIISNPDFPGVSIALNQIQFSQPGIRTKVVITVVKKAQQDAPSNGGQRSSLNSGFPPRRG